jgi:putative membrane protein
MILAIPASPALAQSHGADAAAGSQDSAAHAKLPEPDRGFLRQAAHGGTLQVALSTVAAEKANNPKVRHFAVTSLKNFAMAGGMLHAIAAQLGQPLPMHPPSDVQKLRNALAADSPGQVDHEYLAMVGPPSDVAVNLFQGEVKNGKVPQLVDFARKVLPKLEKHKQMTLAMLEGKTPTSNGKAEAGGASQQANAAPTGHGSH